MSTPNEDRYADLTPTRNEPKYSIFDDEYDCWAVFGEDSGFCYGQYGSKEEADDHL